MNQTINGPYGEYPRKSMGGILNSLHEYYGIPIFKLDDMTFGDGVIQYSGARIGAYRWFDGITPVMVRWETPEFRVYLEDKSIAPEFKLTMNCHDMPAFEISGELATPELHSFLMGMLTNRSDDPRYKLNQEAAGFFQGGSHAPDGGWFMLEFWRPEGAEAFMKYINENYKPTI